MSPPIKPLIIGIGGGTGAGKTTLSRTICRNLPDAEVAYIEHDAYYHDLAHLTPEERAEVNFDHPDSLDNGLLVEHLDALLCGEGIDRPNYDFVNHTRSPETTRVDPAAVVVVEGILIFADPRLADRYDIRMFIDTPADIRILRRIRRDIEQRGRTFEETRQQYYATVRPMHAAFVEPTKYKADLIIPEGANFQVAIDLIVDRIERQLRERAAAVAARARNRSGA